MNSPWAPEDRKPTAGPSPAPGWEPPTVGAYCITCEGPILSGQAIFRHSAIGAPAYGRTGLVSHLQCSIVQQRLFAAGGRRA